MIALERKKKCKRKACKCLIRVKRGTRLLMSRRGVYPVAPHDLECGEVLQGDDWSYTSAGFVCMAGNSIHAVSIGSGPDRKRCVSCTVKWCREAKASGNGPCLVGGLKKGSLGPVLQAISVVTVQVSEIRFSHWPLAPGSSSLVPSIAGLQHVQRSPMMLIICFPLETRRWQFPICPV